MRRIGGLLIPPHRTTKQTTPVTNNNALEDSSGPPNFSCIVLLPTQRNGLAHLLTIHTVTHKNFSSSPFVCMVFLWHTCLFSILPSSSPSHTCPHISPDPETTDTVLNICLSVCLSSGFYTTVSPVHTCISVSRQHQSRLCLSLQTYVVIFQTSAYELEYVPIFFSYLSQSKNTCHHISHLYRSCC